LLFAWSAGYKKIVLAILESLRNCFDNTVMVGLAIKGKAKFPRNAKGRRKHHGSINVSGIQGGGSPAPRNPL